MKEITKGLLERCVPVAESVHKSVFERMKPHIEEVRDSVAATILGDVGVAAIEGGDASVDDCLADMSCNLAMYDLMEQNDVVLTPTGFGVVSNDQLAPASAGRVAAVRESLHRRALQRQGNLIDLLRHTDGWGDTEQARDAIRMPVWTINQSRMVTGTSLTTTEWARLLESQRTTVERLSRMVGERLVDRILDAERHGEKDDYTSLLPRVYRLVAADYDGDMVRSRDVMRRLLDELKRNIVKYPVYEESSAYGAMVEGRYENRQEDACFIF